MSLADLTLDPTVNVEATFLVDEKPLRWIEPSVALFLAPELVAVLEKLGTIVHEALQTVATASAVRGQVFPRDRANTLIQSLIENFSPAAPIPGRGSKRRAIATAASDSRRSRKASRISSPSIVWPSGCALRRATRNGRLRSLFPARACSP
jgi:hypothetical protein